MMDRISAYTVLVLILMGSWTQIVFAQEEPSKWEVNGYVKYLQLTTFAQGPAFPLTNNFFHNRLNIKYFPNEKWTFALEGRNRLFYGEQVKLDSSFASQIDPKIGIIDLSYRWLDSKNVLLHSIIDRAYVNYGTEKWDIRVGRQRINWGLNLVWNPNDLFNALNFLDFDYEERPGVDAIRIQRYTGLLSSAELAFAPADTFSQSVGAFLYKFNVSGYDFQALTGYFKGDLAIGGGWAGSIKGAGFQGEGTFFVPLEPSDDSVTSFSLTSTLDYLLSNGMYVSAAVLYNSNGSRGGATQDGLFTSQLSSKNLFPSTWSFFTTASGNISPILTASGAVLYGKDNNLTILVPTISYSIKENWNIDLILQSLFLSIPGGDYTHGGTSAFLRLKLSY